MDGDGAPARGAAAGGARRLAEGGRISIDPGVHRRCGAGAADHAAAGQYIRIHLRVGDHGIMRWVVKLAIVGFALAVLTTTGADAQRRGGDPKLAARKNPVPATPASI